MAFSKVTLFGETLMDVTQDTVTSPTLFTGESATGANGEKVYGSYVPGVNRDIYASGSVATFDCPVAGKALSSLVVKLNPLQAGSGDPSPSNVRAISGWTKANIYTAGKNLLDISSIAPGTAGITASVNGDELTIVADGTVTYQGVNYGVPSNLIFPPGTYKLKATVVSNTNTAAWSAIGFKPKSNSFSAYAHPDLKTIGDLSWETTITEPCFFSIVVNGSGSNRAATVVLRNLSISREDVPYEPYIGSYKTISWQTEAGTIYGGSLNVTTGELTVTHGQIASYDGEELPGAWQSDRDVYAAGTTPTTGAQVVYELDEPVIYQLVPVDITSLRGENNVWATTGEVEVSLAIADAPKDYYDTEIEQTIRDVLNANTEPGLVFLLCTDLHYLSDQGAYPTNYYVKRDSVTDMCLNMKTVRESIKADGLVCLGDIVDGGYNGTYKTAETRAQVRYVMQQLQGVGLPLIYALGNHDDNRYVAGGAFAAGELYARYISYCPTERVSDLTSNGLNYYIDYTAYNIRCFVIDCNYYADGNWSYGYSDDTLAWFTDQLAAVPSGWSVLVFSHKAFVKDNNAGKEYAYNQEEMENTVAAFIEGGGDYIATIYGHSHVDYSATSPWLEICTCCAKALNGTPDSRYPDGSIKPTRTRGTATEDLWDVLIIQPGSRTIKAVRFGAGSNRSWSY